MSTGEYGVGINTDLEGILEHNTTYYVSVRCINEANLTAEHNDTKGIFAYNVCYNIVRQTDKTCVLM